MNDAAAKVRIRGSAIVIEGGALNLQMETVDVTTPRFSSVPPIKLEIRRLKRLLRRRRKFEIRSLRRVDPGWYESRLKNLRKRLRVVERIERENPERDWIRFLPGRTSWSIEATCGHSRAVENFLERAFRDRSLVNAAAAPNPDGTFYYGEAIVTEIAVDPRSPTISFKLEGSGRLIKQECLEAAAVNSRK